MQSKKNPSVWSVPMSLGWKSGIRVAAVGLGWLLVSCGGDDGGTGPGPTVATITVSTAPAQLFIGETADLTATPRDSDGDVVEDVTVQWRSSNGNIVAVNQEGRLRAFSEGGPVTITASVGAVSATTTTSVITGTPNTNCTGADATALTIGPTFTGHLTTNDCFSTLDQWNFDYWTFTLTATTQIQIDVTSPIGAGGGFDTFLELLNSNLGVIATDDDSGTLQNSRIIQTLNAGTYFLVVRGFDNDDLGPYSLIITIL